MKLVFLDRDGTIIVEPPDEQVDSLEKLELIPGVIKGLNLLIRHGYKLILVSNQDGLGTTSYPYEKYELVQSKLIRLLQGEGIEFEKVFICPHRKEDNCKCRKPKIGLVEEFVKNNELDYNRSYVIGDRATDIEFAKNLGCKSIFLSDKQASEANFVTKSFLEACKYIVRNDRYAIVTRKTRETDITAEVCLDGNGEFNIDTGIGFFDHMLAQIARHSGIDVKLKVAGDLNVDEHHSVEDTGLVLGTAIREALRDKKGIERYSCVLPMDESLANVALDLGGRSYCSLKAKFKREKVGDFPTELMEDFLRAFAEGLKANLHVSVDGRNEHHKIEAIFKALGRALKQAISICEDNLESVPSTKGTLA